MRIHYEGKWEGVGLWKLRVCWALPFGAQKTRDFQGPTPPTCPSYGYAASKTLCTGLYKSYVHRWFYVQEPTREVLGPILWGWESRCIKELNRPARAAQVHKELNRPARAAQVHKELNRPAQAAPSDYKTY